MALKHATTATGTDSADQVTVSTWNADHAIDSNGLVVPVGTPSAPASGHTTIFAKDQGGRPMPSFIGPSGLDSVLQPHMAKNGWAQWKPAGTGTTISVIGAAALTATGTATAAVYATTSLHTRATRIDYLVTVAATTAVAGYRAATSAWRTTDGFHHIFRVCPATGTAGVSTQRFYCGMGTATPTDVNPSTLTNIAGAGYDAADANWQLMTNAGSGTASKIDTGLARPSADRQGIFTVIVFSPPGGAWVGIRLTDESTGTSYDSGQVSTNIPVSTTAIGPRGYHSVGGTSSVTGLTLFAGYMESDN